MLTRFLPLIGIALLAFCGSCAGEGRGSLAERSAQAPAAGSAEATSPAGPKASPFDEQLSLPPLSAIAANLPPARSSSYSPLDLQRDGGEFETGLPSQLVSAEAGGEALYVPDFNPAVGGFAGLSFAIYQLTVPDYGGNARLALTWFTEPAVDKAFVAMANWDEGRWNLFALDDISGLDLPGIASYFDPAGRLVLAVILTGNQPAALAEIRLGSFPPKGFLTVSPEQGLLPSTPASL